MTQEGQTYRQIFEHSTQGMVLRQDDKVILVNQSFAEMVGYSVDELLDLTVEQSFSQIHPQDRDVALARYKKTLAEKVVSEQYEYRFVRRDGSIGWWTAALYTIDYLGKPAVLGTYIDITERKRVESALRESENLLSEIAAHYPNSYLSIIERDLTIGFTAGQEFARQNLDPNDFVGLSLEQVFGERALFVSEQYLRAFEGEQVTFELSINNQHQLYKVVPLLDESGDVPRILAVVENITERKRGEEELKRLAHNLGERVKELNCLYAIAQLVEQPGISMEGIIARTVELIPPAFQYPEITCARIALEDDKFHTSNCTETPWKMGSEIVAYGKPIGTLEVGYLEAKPQADEGPFLKEERELINAITERLGRIVERTRAEGAIRVANQRLQAQLEEIQKLQAQLREQAIRDPLTGLYNRRYLEETLVRELGRALREEYPVCLVMADIDHFKQVNDSHGHAAGDLVLKSLADLLDSQTRSGDIVCRYGGEEFLIVMPNISAQAVFRRAEQWRSSLEASKVVYAGAEIRITMSLGIAECPTHGCVDTELIALADRAMYQAKAEGRNRVVVYEEPG